MSVGRLWKDGQGNTEVLGDKSAPSANSSTTYLTCTVR